MATLTGIIRTEDGSPALGAVVRAFDIDLRSEQLLGETVIEATSGRYEISHSGEHITGRGRRAINRIACESRVQPKPYMNALKIGLIRTYV